MGNALDFGANQSFTVTAWIKVESLLGYEWAHTITSKGQNFGAAFAHKDFRNGQWQHFVGLRNSAEKQVKFYVDGVLTPHKLLPVI